jgi:hypothetical protein
MGMAWRIGPGPSSGLGVMIDRSSWVRTGDPSIEIDRLPGVKCPVETRETALSADSIQAIQS